MLQVGNVGLTYTEEKTHFALWALVSGPLLVGTDVIHASDATLAILTAKEILEVNQDLGVKGKLQGFHVGPCAAAVPSSRHSDGYDSNVIVTKCDGSTAQQWAQQAVSSSTSSSSGATISFKLTQVSTGNVLAVPNCKRAPLKSPYTGPLIVALNASAAAKPSTCEGRNLLWEFLANGSWVTMVDGQCANVYESEGRRVQTFSCAHTGKQSNAQWKYSGNATKPGAIISAMGNDCLSTGPPSPAPGPGPKPPGGAELWAKRMSDGKRIAVALLNRDDTVTMDLSVAWNQLNVSNTTTATVRDLWAEKDLGEFTGVYTAKAVPPHATVMLTLLLKTS